MSGTSFKKIIKQAAVFAEKAEIFALDLLFPRRCPLCGKISGGICADCRKKIIYVRQPLCFHCGKPLLNEEEEYCTACRTHKSAYIQGRSLCLYSGTVRESLYAVKNSNKREYLEYYAKEIAAYLGRDIARWNPQVLIPVPMYPASRRKRGYNQAEILAKELGKQMEIPALCDVLKKIRKTASQKDLDYHSRRSNLKDAFAVNPAYTQSRMMRENTEKALPWNRVLLVDDIYTTGSTIEEAARTLRRAGVNEIYFVTICTVPENS